MPSLVKPLVFGGIDGLTTTLAIVWGSIAAGEGLVSSNAVLVLGVANLMATALSMGIGDYVGTLAEHEANVNSYTQVTPATTGADTSSPDEETLLVPVYTIGERAKRKKEVKTIALKSGLTMFLSFVIFGGVPLLPYLPFHATAYTKRLVSTVLCVVAFFALGAARARMEGGESRTTGSVVRAAFSMMAMGVAASMTSFCSSKAIFWSLGTDEEAANGLTLSTKPD